MDDSSDHNIRLQTSTASSGDPGMHRCKLFTLVITAFSFVVLRVCFVTAMPPNWRFFIY